MKFPVPKTLHGALSPILLITWALGIGIVEYSTGRLRLIISVCPSIMNLLAYLNFLRMANLSKLVKVQESKMVANNYRLNIYFCIAFIIIAMCIAKKNTKVMKGILSELIALNERMNILGISNDYESLLKSQSIELGIAFSLMSILAGIGFKYVSLGLASEWSRIWLLTAAYYFMLFAFVVDYNPVVSIGYLGNRFRRLNELLAELNLLKISGSRVTRKTKNQFPHYLSVMSEIQRYDSTVLRATDERWILFTIKELRKIHRRLCRAAMALNRGFGVQVLLSMSKSFVMIITLLYTAYNLAMASSENRLQQDKWIHVFNILLWNAFYASKVFLIVHACETTSNQANQTGELISKLLNLADDNEDIRDEISIFSFQLIQNPLNFTASGFFTLNYSLVCGIIGSVTTYLVIMIQMRSIYEPNDAISTPNSTMLI